MFVYGSKTFLMTFGIFIVEIILSVNGVICIADVVVVNGDGRSFFGKIIVEKFGLLRVGLEIICSVLDDSDIKIRFLYLFSGVGKLKDYKLKLYIDEIVFSVV